MNYSLITEKLEELIDISARSLEIITDDEANKDNKLQFKMNEALKLMGEITGEINRSELQEYNDLCSKNKL